MCFQKNYYPLGAHPHHESRKKVHPIYQTFQMQYQLLILPASYHCQTMDGRKFDRQMDLHLQMQMNANMQLKTLNVLLMTFQAQFHQDYNDENKNHYLTLDLHI